jgi:hypothetical protein
VKKIRNRLTYANVMSSIAVFLVLGGATAFAATKIGSNQLKANSVLTGKIKKEAVTTGKIKKNAVTGAKVKESSLGMVPSASSVNGQSFLSFHNEMSNDAAALTLFDFGGVKFTGTCPGGKPVINATNTSGVKAAARSALVTETTNATGNGQASFSTFEISKEQLGGGTFEAVFETGKVTSVTLAYRDDTFAGGGCRFFGHVISG